MTTSTINSLPATIASLREQEMTKPRSPWRMAWMRFRRNKLAIGGLIVVLFVAYIALAVEQLVPYKPGAQTQAIWSPPSMDHIMGTDDLGRDVFTRLLYGTRVALAVGFIPELFIVLIGVPIGLIAGFYGGLIDDILMRITDIMYAFPGLLFVLIIVAVFSRSIFTIFIALGIASWPTMTRVVRGQVMQIKQQDFVMSARSIGAGWAGILLRHIFPNVLGSVFVLVTLGFPSNIIAESSLTFIGLGVEPSTPTWGLMVNVAYPAVFSRPLQVLYPALAIASLTLAFSFVGDGVRDAFDPRTRL
jgi:ABC-type dipeptide/oligopeptide/nickel transport system permease subunit